MDMDIKSQDINEPGQKKQTETEMSRDMNHSLIQIRHHQAYGKWQLQLFSSLYNVHNESQYWHNIEYIAWSVIKWEMWAL